MKNPHRRSAFSAILAVMLVFVSIRFLPASAERDTVRIGFVNSEKYGYVGNDGDLRGFDVQLSKTIAMYGDFNAAMQGYDSISDMEEALRSGEVDVLIDFLRTEKREQEFIFTESPILEEQVSLYTLNIAGAPAAADMDRLDRYRIGYVKDSGFLNYFLDYCAEAGVVPRLTDFNNEYEMNAAMEQGETDISLTGSAVPLGYLVLLSLPPLNSYMMLRQEDVSLRNRIDSAIRQIKTDDPDYIVNLYRMYVASRVTEMSPLNARERAYLAEHPEITVAVIRGAEPFTTENEDGSPGGVIPDYYRAMGEKLGASFRFIVYDTTREAIDAVAGGEADILGHYYGDIIIAEKDGLYDTMEYGTTECARLTRSGFSGNVRKAAVTDRTAYLLTEQLDPGIQLVTYANNESCYQALMRGEADAMIGSITGITWLVNQHTMRGITLSILPNVTLGIRGAVSRSNPTLLFILNKAIAVSGSVMNEAIIANAFTGSTSLLTAIENLPLGFSISVVAVLLILVILLIITLIRLSRSSRERVALLNREMSQDNLTGAASRRYGTELLNSELYLYRHHGDSPMIVMFDVDHFKEKNDTYGHEYGDYVLKKVVEVLRGTLRQTDAVIRWGGDEFILVCPRIQGNAARRVLEKVIHAMGEADFLMDGKGEQITVSLGASFFRPEDEDIAAVLRRCDTAMYQAKGARNAYYIDSGEPESGS